MKMPPHLRCWEFRAGGRVAALWRFQIGGFEDGRVADWPTNSRFHRLANNAPGWHKWLRPHPNRASLQRVCPIRGYEDYKVVLEQTLKALPEGLIVVLLADRGFLHRQLMQFARQVGWHYRLRAKASTLVYLEKYQGVRMSQLRPPKGHAHFYHSARVLGEKVHLALATPVPEEEDQEIDSWYVVSDETADVSTLDEYGLRFDIEENFLDDKSKRVGD